HAFASDAFVCTIEAGARGRVATCGGAVEDRTPIAGVEAPTALATLGDQLCAIDRRAQVVCSPLAARYSARESAPSVIAGVQNARSIAAMSSSRQATMCAALESGRVLCWDGVTTQPSREEYVATPVADVGLTDVAALVGTFDWFCSLDRAGAVACWTPDSGRAAPEPGPIIDAEVVQLAAGRYHACALDRSGAVTCWGDESHGQLGRVPTSVSLQPKPLVFAP
ncbi:MAG TPA: RCC1 domain-containing protein, partial [Enhygromyxa sp.]|nr:RCC1 domain-containing protein [Enhygromyxa sp.]